MTIATATASYVGRLVFGSQPSFAIPALQMPYFHQTQPIVLLLYPGLGVLAGLASVAYIRSIYAFEGSSTAGSGGITTPVTWSACCWWASSCISCW